MDIAAGSWSSVLAVSGRGNSSTCMGTWVQMRPFTSGTYTRSIRVLDCPLKHVKKGFVPSHSLATSMSASEAMTSLRVVAPVFS